MKTQSTHTKWRVKIAALVAVILYLLSPVSPVINWSDAATASRPNAVYRPLKLVALAANTTVSNPAQYTHITSQSQSVTGVVVSISNPTDLFTPIDIVLSTLGGVGVAWSFNSGALVLPAVPSSSRRVVSWVANGQWIETTPNAGGAAGLTRLGETFDSSRPSDFSTGTAEALIADGRAVSRSTYAPLWSLAQSAGGTPFTGDATTGQTTITNVSTLAGVNVGAQYTGPGFVNAAVSSTVPATTPLCTTVTASTTLNCQVGQTITARGVATGTNNTFAAGTRITAVTAQAVPFGGTWIGGGDTATANRGPMASSSSAVGVGTQVQVGDWVTLTTNSGGRVTFVADAVTQTTSYFTATAKNVGAGPVEVRPGATTPFRPGSGSTVDLQSCQWLPGRRQQGAAATVAYGAIQPVGGLTLAAATVGATTLTTVANVSLGEMFTGKALHCGDTFEVLSDPGYRYAVTSVGHPSNLSQVTYTISPPLRTGSLISWTPANVRSALDWGPRSITNTTSTAECTTHSPVSATVLNVSSCIAVGGMFPTALNNWIQVGDGVACIEPITAVVQGATWSIVSALTTTNITTTQAMNCAGGDFFVVAPRLTSNNALLTMTTVSPGAYVMWHQDGGTQTAVSAATLTVGPRGTLSAAPSTATPTLSWSATNAATVNLTAAIIMVAASTATGTAGTYNSLGAFGPGDGSTTFTIPDYRAQISIGASAGNPNGSQGAIASGAGQVIRRINRFIVAKE